MRRFEEYIRLSLQQRKRRAMFVLYIKLILMLAMHLNFYNDWATMANNILN